jgi:hypothetical protein
LIFLAQNLQTADDAQSSQTQEVPSRASSGLYPAKRVRFDESIPQQAEEGGIAKWKTKKRAVRAEGSKADPTTNGRLKYPETIDLESASGWKQWNLSLFHVEYTPNEYSDLKSIDPDFQFVDETFKQRNTIDFSASNDRFAPSPRREPCCAIRRFFESPTRR